MANTDETNRPDMIAYVVRDRGEKKSAWREVGVAFAHKDAQGFDVVLDAVPVAGRLTLRIPSPKKEDGE
ncbi:hypothetical protein [Accumulibacter sp.]|uniref:hypothetical protein n=1 Tax=Accumulibacter sp. TaxID=2053492 RepID=UPI00258B6553|nr:hypothetical protein [Accumulibacter sp.]